MNAQLNDIPALLLKYKVEEKDNKEVHGLFVGIIMNMNF
jgi:hypothetical protein